MRFQHLERLLDLSLEGIRRLEEVKELGVVHLKKHASDLAGQLGLDSVDERVEALSDHVLLLLISGVRELCGGEGLLSSGALAGGSLLLLLCLLLLCLLHHRSLLLLLHHIGLVGLVSRVRRVLEVRAAIVAPVAALLLLHHARAVAVLCLHGVAAGHHVVLLLRHSAGHHLLRHVESLAGLRGIPPW